MGPVTPIPSPFGGLASRPSAPAGSVACGRSPAVPARRLEQACAELEALFVSYLFKSMRASIPEAGLLDGGHAEDLYTAMLDEEVARQVSQQRSLGLGAMLRRQFQETPPAGAAPGPDPKGFSAAGR